MFEVSMTLKVKGELVEIDRRIPCLKASQGELAPLLLGGLWNSRKQSYTLHSRDMSTGAELQDGTAVLVTIPDLCRIVRRSETKDQLLPEGFMPIIALVDNADDPQVMKLIISRNYYERDDSDVELIKYTALAAKPGEFPDFQDKFNWLRSGDPALAQLGYDERMNFSYRYLYGVPLEEYQGGKYENLPVGEADGLISLYDLPDFKIPAHMMEKYPRRGFPIVDLWGLFRMSFFSLGAETPTEPGKLPFGSVIPVFQKGGENYYDAEKRGFLMYYRDDNQREKDQEILRWNEDHTEILSRTRTQKSTVVKGDSKIVLTLKNQDRGNRTYRLQTPYFYDPETQYVYRFIGYPITFKK